MTIKNICVAGLAALATCGASAALVHDQNVTNNVIYGSGNTNGGWTVDRSNGIELGLRAKVRYDTVNDQPQNVWNSNGDGTFSHAAGAPAANPTRARWNFDFSINSDTSAASTPDPISEWQYVLGVDFDPTAGTDFGTYDPTQVNGTSFGNNSTAQGQGAEGVSAALRQSNNLAQDSLNLDFLDGPFGKSFNPNMPGFYSFYLEAYNGNQLLGRTEITVIVGDPGVLPEPGSLALAGLALAGIGMARRRRVA